MNEQGVDWLGAEYKRTEHDFSFRHLEQDNCCCSICHGTGAKWEFRYVTRNYQSPKTKKICKTLQAHERSFWICPMCLENMAQITGIQIAEINANNAEIKRDGRQNGRNDQQNFVEAINSGICNFERQKDA